MQCCTFRGLCLDLASLQDTAPADLADPSNVSAGAGALIHKGTAIGLTYPFSSYDFLPGAAEGDRVPQPAEPACAVALTGLVLPSLLVVGRAWLGLEILGEKAKVVEDQEPPTDEKVPSTSWVAAEFLFLQQS